MELAPLPSPGFYSCLFVVWKTSGSWRPVVDLSLLNRFVDVSHFQMETIQSVLLSVCQGDWMASIDLREAYLQVPVHPESRHFLRFVAHGRAYQFNALCFGLSTVPQVFTRVMAHVSTILHSLGVRMRRYLDDWLVQSSSREGLLRDLEVVLSLCQELGIVVNPEKSNFTPSRGGHQHADFYGFSFARSSLQAVVNRRRISALRRASCWLVAVAAGDVVRPVASANAVTPDLPSPLLGSVGSVGSCSVVSRLPSGPTVVASRGSPLSRGVSPSGFPGPGLLVRRFRRLLGGSPEPPGDFRPLGPVGSSSTGQCQGVAGGTEGSPPLPVLSVRCHGRGVLLQRHRGRVPAQGGGHEVSCSQQHRTGDPPLGGVPSDSFDSSVHSGDPQCSRGLSLPSSSTTQLRVVSQHGGVSIFGASVAGDDRPICHLQQSSLLHLFLALPGPSFGRDRLTPPVLGRSPCLRLSALVYSSTGDGEVSGVQRDTPHPGRALLASASLVRGPPPVVGGSSQPARPPLPATVSAALPGSPQAGPSCCQTVQRFTRVAGFSSAVAAQASLACRPSSRSNYQLKWSVYRCWCRSRGHSISPPSLSKVADFLWWLRSVRGLSVSSIKGYQSMLSALFRFHLPDLSAHLVLRDLLRSFWVSAPSCPMRPPAWDLSKVLRFLISDVFEPLRSAPLRALSKRVLFLLVLATAKRVGELQALSLIVLCG